ncbi:MAG: MmcQ/YjbR family DNA-binding protein [Streptococcaceae bacterium]|jgi:predicted DNA-binding protein (MmcQ/YjbR family)|nr:MmcQ/YjbR family DNA-binding protein [Streptococcaceae bacterium]
MTKQEVLDFCAAIGPTYADTPFAAMEKGSTPTIVVRHLKNKKGFAYISEREAYTNLAVKLTPDENDELRESYLGVITPAFHMSKAHWSDIPLDGRVENAVIERLIEKSYDLIKPKR